MIGQRLKIARAASDLSLRELEAAIDNLVTAQAIGKYERNEDMPSSKVLSALARALHVSEDYLLASEEMVLDGVEFRKKSMASKREEAFVEGQALHLLERYLTLEDALGLASVVWDRPREGPYPITAVADAENAARAVRTHWGLGIDPILEYVGTARRARDKDSLRRAFGHRWVDGESAPQERRADSCDRDKGR